MSKFQLPILVRLKDCGEVRRYNSVRDMQNHFEQVDVENDEYEAWDALATPLQLSVQRRAEWLLVEPKGTHAPRQLQDAIREFARLEAVPVESLALDFGDFPSALEQVTSAVRLKRKTESWWQKLKRRF
jgi:hypothetical protein